MNIVNTKVTPMMEQFLALKADYKDALLFYRMGDFYEMFFNDAVLASAALDIALTKRGKHLGVDIPMCGVPVRAAEGYLLSLIKKGFRVAVCEQLEDPADAAKRGAKSVVKRDVVRLVTPGTLTEDSLLDARKNNYLAAYADVRGESSLCWIDISTGAFFVMNCPPALLSPQLARLELRELIISETADPKMHDLVAESGAAVTPLSRSSFDSTSGEKRLLDLFHVASLDGFGQFRRSDLSAMGAIVDYLDLTQKGNLPLLHPPVLERNSTTMQIDAATRRNLELTKALSGGRENSLLATIDLTKTGAGGRLLVNRLSSPSTDLQLISQNLDCVEFFLSIPTVRSQIRDALRKAPDMDRALSRLALDRGGPRDIAAIRNGLEQAKDIAGRLSALDVPEKLREAINHFTGFSDLTTLLEQALVAEPPTLARDGGFVRSTYHSELDEITLLRNNGRSAIASMQSELSKVAAINTLKIKYNKVLGYFVETSSSHAQKMLSPPCSDIFIHRQTTANAVRFTTTDLSALETKILNAAGRALEIELQVFANLKSAVVQGATKISAAACGLAEIDLASSLAELAASQNWCRPIVDDSCDFDIQQGRHPVVEQALRKAGSTPFIANDCDLTPKMTDAACVWLLTGPNMSGKSTFLRQNALIALLAQMGSYVPAAAARIGVVRQLFSRVGASDDLARGRSTFMVEMVETAAILNQAEGGALVILDEIGRGTATYDGLSIAWATVEHLHDVNRCRTLFATHYHELTSLSSTLPGLSNATVEVKEWDGDVIFLHTVTKGAADRSYGVQVAKLAGLPASVVNRARLVLGALEKKDQSGTGKITTLVDDLPLFSATPVVAKENASASMLEAALSDIHPDELSPKEALNLVYRLRDLLKDHH